MEQFSRVSLNTSWSILLISAAVCAVFLFVLACGGGSGTTSMTSSDEEELERHELGEGLESHGEDATDRMGGEITISEEATVEKSLEGSVAEGEQWQESSQRAAKGLCKTCGTNEDLEEVAEHGTQDSDSDDEDDKSRPKPSQATPFSRDATNEEGTPVYEAGTVNVDPAPNQYGDCTLEPGTTNCEGADLAGIDLSPGRANSWSRALYADLSDANLRGVDLTGANLIESVFDGADLRDAKLININMRDGSLYAADLRGADFTGADLTFVDMDDTLLDGTIFCNTTMPDSTLNNEGCP